MTTPDLDLAALLATYEATRYDGDDDEAHDAAREALEAAIGSRRTIGHEPGSLLDIVRDYGAALYGESSAGECGSYSDVLTAQVEAENLFAKIAAEVDALRKKLAAARAELDEATAKLANAEAVGCHWEYAIFAEEDTDEIWAEVDEQRLRTMHDAGALQPGGAFDGYCAKRRYVGPWQPAPAAAQARQEDGR